MRLIADNRDYFRHILYTNRFLQMKMGKGRLDTLKLFDDETRLNGAMA